MMTTEYGCLRDTSDTGQGQTTVQAKGMRLSCSFLRLVTRFFFFALSLIIVYYELPQLCVLLAKNT